MIDVILRLIDRCIELVKTRQATDKALYREFVVPAIDDFNLVHRNYLDSFKRYRDMLSAASGAFGPDHPVIDAIRTDALFSADLRSKIYSLRPLASDPIAGGLIAAIERYMKGTNDHIERYGVLADPNGARREASENIGKNAGNLKNLIRVAYTDNLQDIFGRLLDDASKKKMAIAALDYIVEQMQARYAAAIREHSLLKHRLLSDTKL